MKVLERAKEKRELLLRQIQGVEYYLKQYIENVEKMTIENFYDTPLTLDSIKIGRQKLKELNVRLEIVEYIINGESKQIRGVDSIERC